MDDSTSNDTSEITLIGTGGGYGESVLIKIGKADWIIVDSCIDPFTKDPLPLLYLESINVNYQEHVKLILCTHWHDDHIQGISKILDFCEKAVFSYSRINDQKKFLQFVSLDYHKLKNLGTNSSTTEFNTCLDILRERQSKIRLAHANTNLINSNFDSIESKVYSLSPSDKTSHEFDYEISSLITEFGAPNKKIVIGNPNSKSVTLLLKLGLHRAILGADLEVGNDNEKGWLDILNNSREIDKKSSYFKIPHHGSANGYHQRIWIELLENNPTSTLTPWNKLEGLPTETMIETYKHHTDQLYITSLALRNRPKNRDRQILKYIKQNHPSLSEVRFSQGIIRSRINANNLKDSWHTECFGTANKVH